MALYAFNCYDKDDNIYSIVAEVEYDQENQGFDISYNACWINGEVADVTEVDKFNRDNGYQGFNRAIDEATEQGQSEVWIPVTDPHAAQFVADCENFDRIIFKDLRTIAEESICELQNIAA